jgi:hypothetical protein
LLESILFISLSPSQPPPQRLLDVTAQSDDRVSFHRGLDDCFPARKNDTMSWSFSVARTRNALEDRQNLCIYPLERISAEK